MPVRVVLTLLYTYPNAGRLVCYCSEARRRLWGYLVAGGAGSAQVQKLLALLVESGALYCAIWVRPNPPSLPPLPLSLSHPAARS